MASARLRYNGLQTTLGGSLTNSATSVTFAAALTHSNGTAVPTLAGGDYIPLALCDATTGDLKEIVYLTAYTAAATTGTISRGKEGTTGVAHSTGEVVMCTPLVSDITLIDRPYIVASATAYATTGSPSITIPAGVLEDDLILLFIGANYTTTAAPSGYGIEFATNALSNHNVAVCSRWADGTEGGSSSGSATLATGGEQWTVHCVVIRGARLVVGANGTRGVTVTTQAAPAITNPGRSLFLEFGSARVTSGGPTVTLSDGTQITTRSDSTLGSALYAANNLRPSRIIATATSSASSSGLGVLACSVTG